MKKKSKKRAAQSLIIILILIIGIGIGLKLKPAEVEIIEIEKLSPIEEKQNQIALVAVDADNQGTTSQLITKVREGNGLILVNINDVLADWSTQYSARIAAQFAGRHTGTDLSSLDIIYLIETNASFIGGPSAGSAMAVATIALLENKPLRKDVVITGSIDENGTIEKAGAIEQKAEAAKNIANLFLIPKNSFAAEEYEEVKKCGLYDGIEYCQITYKPKGFEKELGMNVKEVGTVEEALEYFYEQ